MADFEIDTKVDYSKPYEGDERMPVEFYVGARLDDPKSAEAGRPIYEDADFIRIFVNKDEIIDRPVRDTDLRRWPRQYAAWKQTGNNRPGMMGLPLEKWPAISRAQVEELKHFKIYSVEQLASAPDSQLTGIPGVHKLRQAAQAHLDIARGEAPMLKMRAELESRDVQIQDLTLRLQQLQAQLGTLLDHKAAKEQRRELV